MISAVAELAPATGCRAHAVPASHARTSANAGLDPRRDAPLVAKSKTAQPRERLSPRRRACVRDQS